jgi:hypothetical protein
MLRALASKAESSACIHAFTGERQRLCRSRIWRVWVRAGKAELPEVVGHAMAVEDRAMRFRSAWVRLRRAGPKAISMIGPSMAVGTPRSRPAVATTEP